MFKLQSAKRSKKWDTDEPLLETLEARVLFSADFPLLINSLDSRSDADPLTNSYTDTAPLSADLSSTSLRLRLELVFVSQLIPEHREIAKELLNRSDDTIEVLVYELALDEGLDQVSALLSSHQNIDAIHFISHGQSDQLRIGSDVLDTDRLAALGQWNNNLSDNADLAFYGCNIAVTDTGRDLLHRISDITGAGVAASTDLTGPTLLGGDWQLEFDTELIESTLLTEGLDASQSLLLSVTVDQVADIVDAPDLSSVSALNADSGTDGKISLREAILAANADSNHDTIFLDSETYLLADGPDDYGGDLDISNPLTIVGNGPQNTEIDGDHKDRLIELREARQVTITGVELKEGLVTDGGGAIYSNGTDLTLENVVINNSRAESGGGLFLNSGGFTHLKSVVFQNNSSTSVGGALFINEDADNHVLIEDSVFKRAVAWDGDTFQSAGSIWNGGLIQMYRTLLDSNGGANGAGIFNRGESYIAESRFVHQLSNADGGAIYNEGTLTVERSLFESNTANSGGAISNSGTLIINDSTLSGNGGSAIHQRTGESAINRSTLADNSGALAAAIVITDGVVTMQGTLLQRNQDPLGDNISEIDTGTFISLGHNLSDLALPNPHIEDLQNTDAGLSEQLTNIGSYTATYVISDSSPANSGGPTVNADPNAPTLVDVTGLRRGPVSDIGAYEQRASNDYSGPSVTDNRLLSATSNTITAITPHYLYATDPNLPSVAADTIIFTVKDTVLAHGKLLLDGSALTAANNTFTLHDLIDRRVSYQHSGSGASDEFAFTVSDGSSTSGEAKFLIDIEFVNNPPSLTIAPAISVDENTETRLFPALTINDTDDTHLDYAAITFESGYNDSEDSLGFTDGPVVAGNWNAVTGQLEFTGTDTLANYQAALRSVKFQHSSATPDTTPRILLVAVGDGEDRTTSNAIVTVSSIDNPPVISDVEVSAVDYTENDPATRVTNTLQLADDDSTQIQSAVVKLLAPSYDPGVEFLHADTFGSIVSSWDEPTGELRLTGTDTLTNYANTLRAVEYYNASDAPSDDPRTIQFHVTDDTGQSTTAERNLSLVSVNDSPRGDDRTFEIPEDQPLTLTIGHFGFTDPSEGHGFKSIKVTSVPVDNTLLLNGTPVTLNQHISKSDIDAGQLIFTPPPDSHGIGFTTLSFTVTDDGGTDNGGTNTSLAPNTLTFDVKPVNDPPTASDTTVHTTEDNSYVFNRTDFGYQDARDGDNFHSLALTTLPTTGSLTLGGTVVTTTVPPILVTVADLDAGQLIYTPPTDAHGKALATMQFRVIDDGPTTNVGDNNTDTMTRTLTIDVEPVNDPPLGANSTISVIEDHPYEFSRADFNFTDLRDGDQFTGVIFTQLPDKGSLTLSGGPIPSSAVSVVDIDAGQLVYIPPPDDSGNAFTTMQFKVTDDGLFDLHNNNVDSLARTMTINIAPAADGPVGAHGSVQTLEDKPYQFSRGDFTFIDPDSTAFLSAIQITELPEYGQLTLNNQAAETGSIVTIDEIEAGLLKYNSPQDQHGSNLSILTYRLIDDSALTSDKSYQLTVDVLPVSDAPVLNNSRIVLGENTSHRVSLTNIDFSDTPENHSVSTLIVETVPDKGTLYLSGTTVTAGTAVTAAELSAGLLRYQALPNTYDQVYSSFEFHIVDSGNTDNGGKTVSNSATMRIDVTPLRSIPAELELTATTREDHTLVINREHLGLGDFSIDGPVAGIRLESNIVNGRINNGEHTVSAGDFIALSDIREGSLSYTPLNNLFGPELDSLQYNIIERNGSNIVEPPAGQTPSSLTFEVLPVNDPPLTISLSSTTLTEHSDERHISNITIDDIDTDDAFTLTVDDERLHIINGALQLKPGIEIDFELDDTIPITITATDDDGAALRQSFTLAVLNINETPVTTTDRVTHYARGLDTNESLVFSIDTSLFTDPDDDELILTAVQMDGSELPAGISFDTRQQALVIDTNVIGVESIKLKIVAEDPLGLHAELPLNLYFEPNEAQALDTSDTTATSISPEFNTTSTNTASAPAPAPASATIAIDDKTVQSARAEEPGTLLDLYELLNENPAPSIPESSIAAELPEVVTVPFSAAIKTTPHTTDRINPVERPQPATEPPIASATATDRQTADQTDELLIDLARTLNQNKEQVDTPDQTETVIEVSSVVLSSGLSVGYIVWLIRGGAIVASMMSSVPAWRFIDPLPVLEGDSDEAQLDQESLESMVDNSPERSNLHDISLPSGAQQMNAPSDNTTASPHSA